MAQTTTLPYKPVAFEYSQRLDRLVLISGNPNRLHIFDPATGQSVAVPLVQPPLSVAVTPDGLSAVVGHDALVTLVDLEKGAVVKTYSVPTIVNGLIAASNWVYTFGVRYSGEPVALNLATGQSTPNTAAFSLTFGRLNPAVNAIYGTRDGTSPNDVERWEILTGPVTNETDSPYHGDFCIYGPVWFSPDGSRIYTGCGTIFRASTDPKLDMRYLTSFSAVDRIKSLAESSALGRIALLRSNSPYSPTKADEGVVTLYDSAYLGYMGQLTLTPFMAGSNRFAPHGRAVYFTSSSTELIVVKQADETSGLLNDYAVERIPLGVGGDCGAAFGANAAELGGEGGSGSVAITAPASCLYQATTSTPWITLVSGALGSGNGSLSWFAAANPDSVPRTGTIVLPGRVFTIHQAAASTNNSLYVPGYYAVDAAYAKPTNRLVLASAAPNQLHILSMPALADQVVTLNSRPMSVSVDPAGNKAAVGHDGWVTLVDLAAGTVIKEYSVPTDVYRLVLAGNGYAYLFPKADWGDVFSLELATGMVTATSAIYMGREPRLHVNGKNIYVGGNWQSKWDISGGVAKSLPVGVGERCGQLWLTEDGRRLFTECGRAYTTSDAPAQDGQYNGSLSNTTRIVWLDHSAKTEMIALIPSAGPNYPTAAKQLGDTQIQLYNDAFLGFAGTIALPAFTAGGKSVAAHGRYLFWDPSGTELYAVVQADSSALLTGGTAIARLPLSAVRKLAINGIANSASQTPGRVAPGELISLYGSGLGPATGASFTVDPLTQKVSTKVGGTQVYINGRETPVLYASDTQVNTIVPFDFPTGGQYILQVEADGVLSEGMTLTAAASSPAVFTINGTGSGQAVAVNLDGTLCDAAHPAPRGSTIILYFTGGGQTTPGGVTGGVAGNTLKRVANALATVGDVPAAVTFAGAAPGLVEGINQMNLRIDEKTPTGNAVPIILTTGTVSSPATATIAVR